MKVQNPYKTVMLMLFLLLLSNGCKGDQNRDLSQPALPSSSHLWNLPRRTPLPRVATNQQSQEVDQTLFTWVDENVTCQPPSCPSKKLRFTAAEAISESRGQRIMILESFFAPTSAMLRYQKRVLGFFKLSADFRGIYQPYYPSITVYDPLSEISDRLSALPYHVPVEKLSKVKDLLKAKGLTKILEEPPFLSHGPASFELLADLVPEAQFVIAEIPNAALGTEMYCHFDEGNNLDRMEAMYAKATLQLLQLIDKYEINYINISYGMTPFTFQKNFENFCKDTGKNFRSIPIEKRNRFIEIEKTFFEELNYAKGVQIFQALPNSDPRARSYAEYGDGLVCGQYSNFVRVGYFSTPNFPYGRDGGLSAKMLPPDQADFLDCGNVFINGGFVEDDSPFPSDESPPTSIIASPGRLFFRSLGLLMAPARMMATSWATPLAVAHAIHLERRGISRTAEEFKQFYRTNDEKSKMIDPLKFREFELYAN